MKIGWNKWYSYWGYNRNDDMNYNHEISFGHFYVCWERR